MISKIKSVWKECTSNLVEIRKSRKNFPADSVQPKNAMGPPSKLILDNILLQSLIHYFATGLIISIIYSFSLV